MIAIAVFLIVMVLEYLLGTAVGIHFENNAPATWGLLAIAAVIAIVFALGVRRR